LFFTNTIDAYADLQVNYIFCI